MAAHGTTCQSSALKPAFSNFSQPAHPVCRRGAAGGVYLFSSWGYAVHTLWKYAQNRSRPYAESLPVLRRITPGPTQNHSRPDAESLPLTGPKGNVDAASSEPPVPTCSSLFRPLYKACSFWKRFTCGKTANFDRASRAYPPPSWLRPASRPKHGFLPCMKGVHPWTAVSHW